MLPVTQAPNSRNRKPLFISMRWRFILPLFLVIMITAMIGAYMLASQMASGFAISEENVLIQSSQAVANHAVSLYQRQRSEAQRVAFTAGVAEAIIANDVAHLHQILEGLAATANLDSIIVTDPDGIEVVGVLRVRNNETLDYAISTQTDLSIEQIVSATIDEGIIGASSLLQTPQGLLVYVAVPIHHNGGFRGVALVGQSLPSLVDGLQISAVVDLTLYDELGVAYFTTIDLNTETLADIAISSDLVNQILVVDTPVAATVIHDVIRYRTIYTPFTYGENTLAVMATQIPDHVPFVSSIGRQLTAVFASFMTGTVIFATFIGINHYVNRIDNVRKTAKVLSQGHMNARTQMKASDEIGATGAALDDFANVVQQREDWLQHQLRRQRRERTYLVSVLEAMPNGVVVQDREGEVILMNVHARRMLGTQENFFHEMQSIEAKLPNTLGPAIASGLYMLGDPQHLQRAGHMLSAQAAAIISSGGQRVGTVLLINDITDDIHQEQKREKLLNNLSADIQQPLSNLGQIGAKNNQHMTDFTREIARHSASLQKMIVEMRELTKYNSDQAQRVQRPLSAETLIYAVANDWRQIAQAANLDLRVSVDKAGYYILGDESRLRWAFGNIIDNAIKYTLPSGALTLEIKDEIDGMLHMRIRDNGVGITDEDLPNVFMSFYRGRPLSPEQQVLHVPGMGQGLPLARGVIRAHGGLMKVKSRVGIGTAVYIALPLTSGASYSLPLLSQDAMEGETIQFPDDVDFESVWRKL